MKYAVERTEGSAKGLGVQQFPYYSVPQGSRSFPLGIIDDPNDIKIRAGNLPTFVPVSLQPAELDGVELPEVAGSLNDRLKKLSDGDSSDRPRCVYIPKGDARALGVIRILGRYAVQDGSLKLDLLVVCGKNKLRIIETGRADKLDELSEKVVEKVLQEAVKVKERPE